MKPRTKTFEQLVSEYKQELMQSEKQWEKLENRWDRKEQENGSDIV